MELIGKRSLAVLLTVHNRREQTLACLSHLYAQNIPDDMIMDVYMVDDGCTDGTPQIVEKKYPQVNIIQGDGSLYWNRGMWTAWNVASQRGKYNFYLWLNDDTYISPNALHDLLALSCEHNDEAIVVGATKASQNEQLTYGGRNTKNDILACDGTPCEINGYINGNIVLIPQAVYAVLGNLDYYYRHGKGDYDYAVRARKAGIKMYQCGNVLGICDEHERIDTWCNPDVPFLQRWKAMKQPTGMDIREWYHYERNINVFRALFHCVTILLRCMFPKLWVR